MPSLCPCWFCPCTGSTGDGNVALSRCQHARVSLGSLEQVLLSFKQSLSCLGTWNILSSWLCLPKRGEKGWEAIGAPRVAPQLTHHLSTIPPRGLQEGAVLECHLLMQESPRSWAGPPVPTGLSPAQIASAWPCLDLLPPELVPALAKLLLFNHSSA